MTTQSKPPRHGLLAVIAIWAGACGPDRTLAPDDASTEPTTGTTSVATTGSASTTSPTDAADLTTDPSATTTAGETSLEAGEATGGTADPGSPCPRGSHTIYLNRSGGAWTQGTEDSVENTTEILIGDPLAPYEVDDATWTETVACVRGLLDGLDVVVTDADPGVVDHIEIAITDDPSDQHGFGAGVFSVGLPTCELQPRGVGFVFVESTSDRSVQNICTSGIGFALGVASGLERTIGPCEVMSHVDCLDALGRRFLDEEFLCGSEEQTPCFCGGALQNSWQTLRENFGLCPE